MSAGPSVTMQQVGRQRPDHDEIEVLLTVPVSGPGKGEYLDRVSVLRLLGEGLRLKLAEWSKDALFVRWVTGHDTVLDVGLLAGMPLLIKGARLPLHITGETEWEQIR